MKSLFEMLERNVRDCPDMPAIVKGDVSVSYLELWAEISRFAAFARSCVKQGDRVAILMENCVEYVATMYGAWAVGGVAVGLNTACKAAELVELIRHSGAVLLVVDARHVELPEVLKCLAGGPLQVIVVGNLPEGDQAASWESLPEGNSPAPDVVSDQDRVASIIYTSGTTGKPKGVMLSHANIFSNIQSIVGYLPIARGDRFLCVLPFYYSYGHSVLHMNLAMGATLILENSFMYPQRVLKVMEQHKVTGFAGVPSTFALLTRRVSINDFDLSSLRYITQAGGAMAPSLVESVRHAFPWAQLFIMYGQTEATARLAFLPPEWLESKKGGVGVPVAGVSLRICGEQGESVQPGVPGEVQAKGPNVMMGYWRDEVETDNTIIDGWLKTGDLGYLDNDGCLFLTGRKSEMIKSGAHRINPKEIEEKILTLDGVDDVAVTGVPDEILGQVVSAYVVLQTGADITERDIMRFCKSALPNYKIPKYVNFVCDLPKTASGKVKKHLLIGLKDE